MDYEKKYKRLYNFISDLYPFMSEYCKEKVEGFLPEIKESEDEKVRKDLIAIFKGEISYTSEEDAKRYITWLEKQGRKKPADKIEPQFKPGDWIVNNDDSSVGQITKIIEGEDGFAYEHTNGYFHGIFEKEYHLWTIQDAKDGDFLACPLPNRSGAQVFIFKEIGNREYVDKCIEYYCRVCCDKFYESNSGYMGNTSDVFMPATSEQRTLLIQKMHESGYKWDSDKKELKKIDNEEVNGEDYGIDGLWHAQRILENTLGSVNGYQSDDGILEHKAAITAVKKLYKQKPAEWSEEDEHRVNDTIYFLETAKKHYASTVELDACINWLQSLKQRYIWKPSDEQMKQLGWIAEQNKDNMIGKELISLYQDLKKLREE